MNDPVIVDTDVLVDAGRGKREAIACLEEIERVSSLTVSVVTEMELIVGCSDKAELRKLDRFLRRFEVIRLSEHISSIALDLLRRYRLSHGLLIADSLIAATALSLDRPFETQNRSDYQFIPGLRLLPFPKPFAGAS